MQTACGHVYHQTCLRDWIRTNNAVGCCCCCDHVTVVYFPCPMCRGNQVAIGNRWIVDRAKLHCVESSVQQVRELFHGPNCAAAAMLLLYLSILGLIYFASLASMRLRPRNGIQDQPPPAYVFEDFD